MQAFEVDTAYCPSCQRKLPVVWSETRIIGNSRVVMRRKKCQTCPHTIETAEIPRDLAREILIDD